MATAGKVGPLPLSIQCERWEGQRSLEKGHCKMGKLRHGVRKNCPGGVEGGFTSVTAWLSQL